MNNVWVLLVAATAYVLLVINEANGVIESVEEIEGMHRSEFDATIWIGLSIVIMLSPVLLLSATIRVCLRRLTK